MLATPEASSVCTCCRCLPLELLAAESLVPPLVAEEEDWPPPLLPLPAGALLEKSGGRVLPWIASLCVFGRSAADKVGSGGADTNNV